MENNNQNNFDQNNFNNIPQLEPIDLKEIFFKVFQHWFFILVTVVVFLAIAFTINRYSTRLFKTEMTLLIEDESSNSGPAAVMERMGYSNPRLNFFNEKLILGSFTQIERTVKKLDFEISYYTKGSVKTVEVYHPSNFNVEYDTLHPQIVGVVFDVILLDNKKVLVNLELADNYTPKIFNLKDQNRVDSVNFDFISKEYNIGEWIVGNSFKFKINTTDVNYEDEGIDFFSFIFNTDESLANRYYRYVTIAPSAEESSGMNLSTIGPNGSKDIVLLNTFAQTYIEYGLALKNEISDNTVKFIDHQVIGIQDSLNYAEDLLQRFRSDNKVIDLSSKGTNLFEKLIEIESQLSKDEFRLQYYNSIKKYLNKGESLLNVSAPSAMGIEDPLLNKMIIDLSSLYAQRTSLRAIANENNPQITSLNIQIKQTKEILKENLNNIISNVKLIIKDHKSRLSRVEQKVQDLPKTERSYIKIERKFKLSEGLYTFLMQKRAEAGIAKAGNIADNKIIDFAKTHRTPLKPNTQTAYAIALLLGLILPIGIILGLDYLNNKIKSRKQLERITPIPVLGVVGHSDINSNLIVYERPKTAVSESFRAIRADLNFLLKDKKVGEPKVILVTSSIGGEGKTFTSLNIATVIANGGKKVALLGVDLRKPKIFNDFKLKNDVGISNYLIGQVSVNEILQQTFIENLSIIPSGAVPPNPSELLLGDRFEILLNELKKDFEFIILDTPPVGLVADAFQIMHLTDASLFMVRQNYTEENVLEFINDKYTNKIVKNISIIFNDFNHKAGYGYGYGSGYGYGYGYGYYDEENETKKSAINKLFRRK